MPAPKLWIQGGEKPDVAKALAQFDTATEWGRRAVRMYQQWLRRPLVPSNAVDLQKTLNDFYKGLQTDHPEAFK